MRRLAFAFAALLLAAAPVLAAGTKLAYPDAPRGTVSDTYFGTTVADPYRWMEDVDAPQTTAWVKAEGDLTRSYLDAIPQRNAIRDAYRKLIDYEKVSAPYHQGNWWFFSRNSGLQNQSVLYVRRGEHGTPRVLLDPNTLAADGTVALAGQSFTHDGSLMAYATQSSGPTGRRGTSRTSRQAATGRTSSNGASSPAHRGPATAASTTKRTTRPSRAPATRR